MSVRPPSDDDERADGLSPDQVDEILDRAADLMDDGSQTEGISLSELAQAAAEAGIPASAVEAAASEVLGEGASLPKRSPRVALATLGCGLLIATGLLALMGLWRAADSELDTDNPVAPLSASDEAPSQREQVARKAASDSSSMDPASSVKPAPVEQQDSSLQPKSQPGTLLEAGLLSGSEATDARRSIEGSWDLTSWVSGWRPAEIPAKSRASNELPPESWEFFQGGRFRRTIGDDFAVSGRWTVASRLGPLKELEWLGIESWWLLALDDVSLSALPGQVRPREWVLVGADGEERVVFYLGRSAVLGERMMGGRFRPRRDQ